MKSRIYLDHAAATPLSSVAWMAMEPVLLSNFGNPSSLHKEGVASANVLRSCHVSIAKCIGAHADEIVLMSGATDSINLAVIGSLKAGSMKGKHVITVATEHAAVLGAILVAGANVTIVPVDDRGHIDAESIVKAIRPDTVLISVMMANNEIGVVHDIHHIGKTIEAWRKKNGSVYPLFHSDASQAPNYLSIDVALLHVDLLTLSSPKVYGPKGTGALFIRRNAPWSSVFGGGKQEGGRRPGTENISGAVGFGSALTESVAMREKESARLLPLREKLMMGLLEIDGTQLNGDHIRRLPNNVNVSFKGIEGEELVIRLDAAGIAISTGSACKGGSEPSHVLAALGLSTDCINSSVRFTLGRSTTEEDIRRTILTVREIVLAARFG